MTQKPLKLPRIRILKTISRYKGEIGRILHSNSNGTFRVQVITEGYPEIDLYPEDIDPC